MRKFRQFMLDILKRQAELLGNQNETDAADVRSQETALVTAGADRFDQAFFFVETDSRDREASAARHLADRDEIIFADRSGQGYVSKFKA